MYCRELNIHMAKLIEESSMCLSPANVDRFETYKSIYDLWDTIIDVI